MLDSYLQLRWNDVLDITLVAILLWVALVWLRRTRARLAFTGLLILLTVFLVARQLGLQLTLWILQGFSAVLFIILVIVFQDDLKQLFERIAIWGLRRRPAAQPARLVDVVVRAVTALVEQRSGALLVFPGRAPLDRHLDGGIDLDATVSEPLLLSIFDSHSAGHDGAVVFNGGRAARFAVHLPLSTRLPRAAGGTRHAAALGLAERSDALVAVVSEERGVVSVARGNQLRQLESPERLTGELERFFAEITPDAEVDVRLRKDLARRWAEGLAAVALSAILWALLIHGSGTVEVVRSAEIEVENLPAGYVLEGVEPPTVDITLQGPRRIVFLGERKPLRARIDAVLVELGRITYEVRSDQVEVPSGLEVVAIEPSKVRLSVRQ